MQQLKAVYQSNSSVITWVSWYKKSAGIPTDCNRRCDPPLRAQHDLVDIKVCAVSEAVEWPEVGSTQSKAIKINGYAVPNMHPKSLAIKDFTYELPEERIAKYPLAGKRQLKTARYTTKDNITEDTYRHIDQYLPSDSLLLFNNTRVVEARLLFQKATGASIEIFCLEPHPHYPDITTAMSQKERCQPGCASMGGFPNGKPARSWKRTISRMEVISTACRNTWKR